MIKLAIVIPYYKIDFFEETLKSVALQTDKRFTLYIGNDASSDDPFPVIKKYFDENEFHYFNYQENLGGKNLALQWERILENVNEEWFQILGDDDTISINFVDEFYKNIDLADQNKTNVLKFSQCFINDLGEITNDFTTYPKLSSAKSIWRSKYVEKHRSSLSEHIFRKESYLKYNFKHFPLAWFSDDFAVLEWSEGSEIIFINEAKVFVRMSSVNISSMTSNDDQKDKARHEYLELILNQNSYLLTKAELIKELDYYLHLTWKNKYVSNIKLLPIFLKTKPFYKIFKIPYLNYLLRKNIQPK